MKTGPVRGPGVSLLSRMRLVRLAARRDTEAGKSGEEERAPSATQTREETMMTRMFSVFLIVSLSNGGCVYAGDDASKMQSIANEGTSTAGVESHAIESTQERDTSEPDVVDPAASEAAPPEPALDASGSSSPSSLASGVPFSDPASICSALVSLGDAWEQGEIPRRLRDFVPVGGVLRVSPNRRATSCGSTIASGDAPDCSSFKCDSSLERCSDGESIFLLNRGKSGLFVFATIEFGGRAPRNGLGDAGPIVARRDHVCELYERVIAGRVPAAREGYLRRRQSEDVDLTLRGSRARRAAAEDLAEFRRLVPNLACTQSYCFMDLASNGADLTGFLLARRDSAGYVLEGVDQSPDRVVPE